MRTRKTLISREAYTGFVSFVFAAALVSWGTTFLGINPLSVELRPPDLTDPRRLGLDYISSLDIAVLFGGLLYGIVLICFYWIYAEYLTTHHLPRRPWILPLDFIALSFMTGAAASWIHPKSFVFLAFATVLFLLGRFGVAAWSEWAERVPFKQQIMTHIVGVYCVVFLILLAMLFGAVLFGGLQALEDDKLYYRLYWIVIIAMICGIVTTTWHASKNRPYSFPAALIDDAIPASEYGMPLPRLVPDYRDVAEALTQISSDIRAGESRFRHLLRYHSRTRTLSPHLSRVHSLRDVEVQAFIMGHPAADPATRQLRAMWVYLAHWFDDLFDNYYPDRLAWRDLSGSFAIGGILNDLDEAYSAVWLSAVRESRQCRDWNIELLEMGMRRLILGGPLFSARCTQDRRDLISGWHRNLVIASLEQERQNPGARELIELVESTPLRHLDHTAKVVVEIWDSFESNSRFSTSLMMNYLYAPGLLYHDYLTEEGRGEIEASEYDDLDQHMNTLRQVAGLVLSFPKGQLTIAVKPIPMFVRCFRPVLEETGRTDLLNIYYDILENEEVKRITRCGPEGHGRNLAYAKTG